MADIASYIAVGRPASKFDIRNVFELLPIITWAVVLILSLATSFDDAGVDEKLRGGPNSAIPWGDLFLWNKKALNTLAGQTLAMGILLVSSSVASVLERNLSGIAESALLFVRSICQVSFVLVSLLSFSLVASLPTLLAVDEKGREGTVSDITINLITGLQMLSVVLFLRRELPTINVSADSHDSVGYSPVAAGAKPGLPTVAAAKGDDITINFDRKIHSYY